MRRKLQRSKELDSKKKKRRKGSGEGNSGDHVWDERHGGQDTAFVQASKAELKMPPSLEDEKASGGCCSVSADGHWDVELVDPSQQEAAAVVDTQKKTRAASPSPRDGEGSGANSAKRVKIGLEVEEEKHGTEVAARDLGSEGSCKVRNNSEAEEKKVEKNCMEEEAIDGSKGSCSNGGSGSNMEPNERDEELRARRLNDESEVPESSDPCSLAGIGCAPKVVVAMSPKMPQRYGYLLKLFTFLLPCESQGRAYERSLHRIEALQRQTGCSLCLFFEWKPEDKKPLCWMFNTLTKTRVQFLVNPAFTSGVLDVKVKRASCSFSSNFGDGEAWGAVKQMLEMMFCPPQYDSSVEPDHLYIFTRIDDCIYFRNMKIDNNPIGSGSNDDALVLNEVGPYFCLKLLEVHRESAVLCQGSGVSQSQITAKMRLCPTLCYSLSPQLRSSMFHSLSLNGETYLIVLENALDLSAFEGYSVSLLEFLVEQSFLKKKKIVGSKDEECTFVRNIGKLIIRSILSHLLELFSSGKCVRTAENLNYTHILVKGSAVKFFGVELAEYEEHLADRNVSRIVDLIIGCFPDGLVPLDLMEMFDYLLEDPVKNLESAKEDPSLLTARERRELMIRSHTEYMTNVKPALVDSDDNQKWNAFFMQCPNLDSWMDTMSRNRYLSVVANYNSSFETMRLDTKGLEGKEGSMGEFQFSIMRNCDVHIPENVGSDGITPFRLSWTDYIRTTYFPTYLSFIHRRMASYKQNHA